MSLGVKFLDFDSIERCLFLDLDSRYDLILVWSGSNDTSHELSGGPRPLGATRNVSSGALESHEPTFARQQKRYWREPLTVSVIVLDIGMSELIDSDVNDNCETARTPLSCTCCYKEPLDTNSIDDPRLSHFGFDPLDICAVAREHPQSEGGCHSTSLNVGNDIVSEMPQHQE